MDKELKDEETRNWVKTCLALRYVTEGIVSYVKKACEEKYLIDIDHLKDVCGISDYTCNMCNVKELKPYHARLFPCKYQQYIRRCGCQGQNKKTCLQNDICGVFYDLIIDNHVKSNPKWSNTKCELWSDQRTGPWEVMKCYICTPGYEKKPDIFQADVTALVQICMNDRDLQTRLGYRLVLLEKIREIRNEVCHSATMQMSTDCFKQHVRHMKDVLRLDIFKGNKAAKDGRKKLKSLKKEAKQVTVEDEMNAREDTIAAIKELKKLIEQSEDSHEIARQKIAHLTSVEDKHKRELEKQFDEITSHLQDLKKRNCANDTEVR
ncbi:hypothetical protein DPMN_119397 [Dreissena polymorpha]|uniref:Uncharacterized protein n=1 Tax=Dreissena polymorpha TaxID=45954 RepID=A0A9D4GJ88_DREPO|nr:hypothetical protein DPMN_119397 [Dreissena polymorpha]